jgi:hypothetical protein
MRIDIRRQRGPRVNPSTDQARIIAGLHEVAVGPLERVPVRARDSHVTVSAWRVLVDSDTGSGGIVLLELSSGEHYYRGEGVFLGWPQEKLASTYRALLPEQPASETQTLQLG